MIDADKLAVERRAKWAKDKARYRKHGTYNEDVIALRATLAERDATIANLTAANVVLMERVEEARVVVHAMGNSLAYEVNAWYSGSDAQLKKAKACLAAARAWLAGKAGVP